jgi:acetyltransferase-like isoleucine patch superfamily enzyme
MVDVAKNFVAGSAKEARVHAKELMKHPAAQKIAGGAALGAGAALIIPFVSIGVGAVVGAGFIAYRNLLK